MFGSGETALSKDEGPVANADSEESEALSVF
jgi:hypothetical protein